MSTIHPKVSAAAFGGMLVTLFAAIMASHNHALDGSSVAALTTVVAAVAGWLMPSEYATVDDTFATDEEIDS